MAGRAWPWVVSNWLLLQALPIVRGGNGVEDNGQVEKAVVFFKGVVLGGAVGVCVCASMWSCRQPAVSQVKQ